MPGIIMAIIACCCFIWSDALSDFFADITLFSGYEEIFKLFEVAAANNVPCHLHARYKGNIFPLTMSLAVQEVIAMAAATVILPTEKQSVTINNSECVAKSYPSFYEDLKQIGGQVNE